MPLRVSDGDGQSFDTFDIAEMSDRAVAGPADFPRGHPSYPCPSRGSRGGGGSSASSGWSGGDPGGPLYEDNLDEAPLDPRHSVTHKPPPHRRGGWGECREHIPEEDEETTLSTMEASSVSPSLSQQYSASSRLSLSHRSQSQRPQRHLRPPRQPYDSIHEAQPYVHDAIHEVDDVSVLSCQSRTQDRRHSDASHTSQSVALRQLEALVAQLSLELATAKAAADELRLEGRRAAADRDLARANLRLLQEENDHLHATVDRMERERLLTSMEGTTGRSAAAPGRGPRAGGGEDASAGDGGALEVPFAVTRRHHLHPKRRSVASVDLLDEPSDDDVPSDGHRPRASFTVEDLGPGRSRPPWEGMLGRPDAAAELRASAGALAQPRRSPSRDGAASPANDGHDGPDRPAPGGGAGDPDAVDDPFATWSARGDPKREEDEPGPPRRWRWGGGRDTPQHPRPPTPPRPRPAAVEDRAAAPAVGDDDGDYSSFGRASDGDGSEDSQPRRLGAFHRLLGGGRKT